MKDDGVYLSHIRECIRRIEVNTEKGYDLFMENVTLQDAVLRNLQTMAESTQRLSDTVKQCHREVEWDRIAGFRNVIVHDYLGIDLEIVWRIIQNDLPSLKRVTLKLLN